MIFLSCDVAGGSSTSSTKAKEKDPVFKRIIITDNDKTYGFKVSGIDKEHYIVMALTDKLPYLDHVDVIELMVTSNIAIGKPTGDTVNLPIYEGFVKYWTETGAFWCVFIEMNKSATYAYRAFISKEQ
ncbi:hypothetical protein FACS1894102_2490 [Spirochaetia bacterium]|nr:hypothetical protein FACS1894102_2490 [Spirochaetia bacterium]